MSENSVRIHVSAILKTLGLHNRTEAALWWRENGGAVETIVRDERRAA